MKLFNSVLALKNFVECNTDSNTKNRLTVHINNLKNNPNVEDYKKRFRWDLWWSIPTIEREKIISDSIPRDQWVGGYPDINDSHIETLLKKVFDTCYIINVETGLIINRKTLLK